MAKKVTDSRRRSNNNNLTFFLFTLKTWSKTKIPSTTIDFKNETTTATTTSEDSPLSPCSTYGGGYSGEDHTRWLVESAMKGKKGRYESEEKWGPLYIEGGDQSPQTVPNLHDAAAATVVGDAWGNASIDVWRVPEVISNDVGGVKIKEEVDGTEDWKRGHREASVLRYKEKRQNRLFAKRIRYEVRKVNAEKRPRLKGRFVKRD
ncbi:hypothetical protein CCACVL1_06024 [Corchorus capsularis]|uniref:CCT domain-containing protein n=1 Tax=Corchorus capsularis TaxID=210143 RepID=A0A1R3JHW8_COCAP|nr:hypothetical protein CCACVL1_06024 [Corchorus capsularis]